MSTWFQESQELFADSLAEWPQGRGAMIYKGYPVDVIKGPIKKSFQMEGMNYKPQRDCQVDVLREDFQDIKSIQATGLYDDWKTSSREKRPIVEILGDKFLAMEMDDDAEDAAVHFLMRALI